MNYYYSFEIGEFNEKKQKWIRAPSISTNTRCHICLNFAPLQVVTILNVFCHWNVEIVARKRKWEDANVFPFHRSLHMCIDETRRNYVQCERERFHQKQKAHTPHLPEWWLNVIRRANKTSGKSFLLNASVENDVQLCVLFISHKKCKSFFPEKNHTPTTSSSSSSTIAECVDSAMVLLQFYGVHII